MAAYPKRVRTAMERLQLDIAAPGDEALVSAWLDWALAQNGAEDKECPERPAKRLKRQASVSLS